MTNKADIEALKIFTRDAVSGQIAALAVVTNALIKQGLLDRDDLINDLNRAQNIYRSNDQTGAISGALSDLAKFLPALSGL